MANCSPSSPSASGGEVTALDLPITDAVRAFWGKSVFIRGREKYPDRDPLSWAVRGEIDILMLSPTIRYRRSDADEILRQGKKVGWWTKQSEMKPEGYQHAVARLVAISRPGEPFVLNWEQARSWANESDRLAFYDLVLSLEERNPIMISTLERYRWLNHAAPHLSGHVVLAPEQYSLGVGHTTGVASADTANREAKRVQLATKWGGRSRIIPTVAGYGRERDEMVTYLQTFSNEKGAILWGTRAATHRIVKQWTTRS